MGLNLHNGEALTRRTRESRIPRWLRPILQVPLEAKLLGANLIIVGIALLLMLGPVQLEPSRLTDAYIVVGALILAAAVNAWLVRLALAPLKSIERVAKWVSQGRLGERVPASVLADRELARVSRTINEMLDGLVADRKRIEQLAAELAYREETQGSQASRPQRGPSADGIVRAVVNTPDAR
jgi:methyl-accepting chemotaxis protein